MVVAYLSLLPSEKVTSSRLRISPMAASQSLSNSASVMPLRRFVLTSALSTGSGTSTAVAGVPSFSMRVLHSHWARRSRSTVTALSATALILRPLSPSGSHVGGKGTNPPRESGCGLRTKLLSQVTSMSAEQKACCGHSSHWGCRKAVQAGHSARAFSIMGLPIPQ